jgi:hypothetical protein
VPNPLLLSCVAPFADGVDSMHFAQQSGLHRASGVVPPNFRYNKGLDTFSLFLTWIDCTYAVYITGWLARCWQPHKKCMPS